MWNDVVCFISWNNSQCVSLFWPLCSRLSWSVYIGLKRFDSRFWCCGCCGCFWLPRLILARLDARSKWACLLFIVVSEILCPCNPTGIELILIDSLSSVSVVFDIKIIYCRSLCENPILFYPAHPTCIFLCLLTASLAFSFLSLLA